MEQLCPWSHLNRKQNNSIFWLIDREHKIRAPRPPFCSRAFETRWKSDPRKHHSQESYFNVSTWTVCMWQSNKLLSAQHHPAQFPALPQGSAVALWYFPLPLKSPPRVDLFIYPRVASNILFICSSEVYWNESKLALLCSLCSSTNHNAKDLLAVAGSRRSSATVSSGCIQNCFLRINRNSEAAAPTVHSSDLIWIFPWQLARGRDTWWGVALCIFFISTDSHPPTKPPDNIWATLGKHSMGCWL